MRSPVTINVSSGGAPAGTPVNPTAAEMGYLSGVTSAIQTQLGTKAPTASPTFTGTVTLPAALNGLAKMAAGVVSEATANSDYVTPINPAPSTSPGYSGPVFEGVNGSGAVTLAFGDVCYVDAAGKLQPLEDDALETAMAFAVCVGTTAGGVSGTVAPAATGLFMLPGGFIRNDAWTLTMGGRIYNTSTGASGSTWSQTAPASGKYAQKIGVATSANPDIWFFIPGDVYLVA